MCVRADFSKLHYHGFACVCVRVCVMRERERERGCFQAWMYESRVYYISGINRYRKGFRVPLRTLRSMYGVKAFCGYCSFRRGVFFLRLNVTGASLMGKAFFVQYVFAHRILIINGGSATGLPCSIPIRNKRVLD